MPSGIRTRTSGIMIPAYVTATSCAAGYLGPGDIIEAAVWYGLRAYKSSIAGSAFAIVRLRSSDGTEADFTTTANGLVNTSSVDAFIAAHGSSISIAKLYNQSTASTIAWGDVSSANTGAASLPTYQSSGFPHIQNSTGSAIGSTITTSSKNQPLTFTMVFYNNPDTVGDALLTTGVSVLNWTGANDMVMFAGSIAAATVTDSVWHSGAFVFNDVTSDLNIDGTTNTLNPGTGGIPINQDLRFGNSDGNITAWTEGGLYLTALSGATMTALSTNAQGFWGY